MRSITAALFLVPCILISFLGEISSAGQVTNAGTWHYWMLFGHQLWAWQLRAIQALLVIPGLYFLVTGELLFWIPGLFQQFGVDRDEDT